MSRTSNHREKEKTICERKENSLWSVRITFSVQDMICTNMTRIYFTIFTVKKKKLKNGMHNNV